MKLSAEFKIGYRIGLGFWCSLMTAFGIAFIVRKLIYWIMAKFWVLEGVRWL